MGIYNESQLKALSTTVWGKDGFCDALVVEHRQQCESKSNGSHLLLKIQSRPVPGQ